MFPEDHILKKKKKDLPQCIVKFCNIFGWCLNKRVGHRGELVT